MEALPGHWKVTWGPEPRLEFPACPNPAACTGGACAYVPNSEVCEDMNVCTHPDVRGKGYATALMEEAVQYMRESGYPISCLFTEAGNRFYRRFGYRGVPLNGFRMTQWKTAEGFESEWEVTPFDEACDLNSAVELYDICNRECSGNGRIVDGVCECFFLSGWRGPLCDIPGCPGKIYKGKGWAGFGDWLGCQPDDDEECPCCLDPLPTNGYHARIPGCGHRFHRRCVNQLRRTGHTLCPMCRGPLG